jgi:hypothetical protein
VPAARLRNRTSRSDRLSEEGVPAHLGPARTKIKASTVWFESLANDAIRTKVRGNQSYFLWMLDLNLWLALELPKSELLR